MINRVLDNSCAKFSKQNFAIFFIKICQFFAKWHVVTIISAMLNLKTELRFIIRTSYQMKAWDGTPKI